MHKGIGLLLLSAGIAVSAQNPGPPAPVESPTFHAGTKLVEVDVVARGKGAPATGLAKDDFTILDNDKPQKIAFFSVRSANTPAHSAPQPLPPGTFSNRTAREGGSSGSTTVVLVDQLNTSQVVQLDALPRVATFIEMRHVNDRIGIYTLQSGGSLQVMQELTDDGDLLNKAAKTLRARDPNRRSSDTTGMSQHAAEAHESITLMERGMDTKHALQAIAHHLANVPGRKTLVWLTNAFPLYNPELGIDFRPDLQEAARALNDANTAVYGVDPRGLVGALSGTTAISSAETPGPNSQRQLLAQMHRGGESAAPNGFDTMNMMASLTGGLVFKNDNGVGEMIQDAVDDGIFTYTLGFYPQDKQDGTWHDVKVEVGRPGVRMRYRKNYFAARAIDDTKARPDLGQLLKDPLDSAQLELTAETAPDPGHPGVLRIKVNLDLHNIELRHENAIQSGSVDLSFYVRETGKAITRTFKIDIPDDQFAAYLEKGLTVVQSVDTNGGVEAVRVVAQDRITGAAGSVTIPVRK